MTNSEKYSNLIKHVADVVENEEQKIEIMKRINSIIIELHKDLNTGYDWLVSIVLPHN